MVGSVYIWAFVKTWGFYKLIFRLESVPWTVISEHFKRRYINELERLYSFWYQKDVEGLHRFEAFDIANISEQIWIVSGCKYLSFRFQLWVEKKLNGFQFLLTVFWKCSKKIMVDVIFGRHKTKINVEYGLIWAIGIGHRNVKMFSCTWSCLLS